MIFIDKLIWGQVEFQKRSFTLFLYKSLYNQSEINQDIKLIGQFDQDLFIESVSKLLNTLNPSNEPLPTKLPPNTGVKFRICTKFATVCQVNIQNFKSRFLS